MTQGIQDALNLHAARSKNGTLICKGLRCGKRVDVLFDGGYCESCFRKRMRKEARR
jgi:hypothetical protein